MKLILINMAIKVLQFHQGTSVTVAMDQTRQAIQLCGKLLFAQMSEMLNVKMSNGLPPYLNGSDISLGTTCLFFLFMLIWMIDIFIDFNFLCFTINSHHYTFISFELT